MKVKTELIICYADNTWDTHELEVDMDTNLDNLLEEDLLEDAQKLVDWSEWPEIAYIGLYHYEADEEDDNYEDDPDAPMDTDFFSRLTREDTYNLSSKMDEGE